MNDKNLLVRNNVAKHQGGVYNHIGISSDTSDVVESNVADYIYVDSATDSFVVNNTMKQAR
jgi:hypothetical protein